MTKCRVVWAPSQAVLRKISLIGKNMTFMMVYRGPNYLAKSVRITPG